MSLSGAEKAHRLQKALEYGGGTHRLDDVVRMLKAGEANYVARGIVHRQQNLSDKPARYVVINILDKGKPVAEPVPE